jgi:undecaprenyl-phosphate 4-deoxy-4-formamido-L-arabinose transferase
MKRPFGLSIVIPVYNGAQSIGRLIEALEGLEIAGGHEAVLVVDGSPDDSEAVCRRMLETSRLPITVVSHARNYGEHNAVMTGLRHARGDYIITMDDDLQNPPAEVVRLYEHARHSGKDVVYTYYRSKEHALWRNLGSRFANWVADVLLAKPKHLYMSSFRCMSAFVAEQVSRHTGPFPHVDGLVFQVTNSVDRLEVQHLPRADGRSNYTLRRLINLWLSIFLNFSVVPLRLATFSGLALSAAGLVGVAIVLIEAVFFETPQGWASLMAIVLLVAGVQLVLLGLIGEYLGRLFLTANNKPQSVVREVFRRDNADREGATVAPRRVAG